jgi:hypothetical protein
MVGRLMNKENIRYSKVGAFEQSLALGMPHSIAFGIGKSQAES